MRQGFVWKIPRRETTHHLALVTNYFSGFESASDGLGIASNGVESAPDGVESAPNGVESAPDGVESAPDGVESEQGRMGTHKVKDILISHPHFYKTV